MGSPEERGQRTSNIGSPPEATATGSASQYGPPNRSSSSSESLTTRKATRSQPGARRSSTSPVSTSLPSPHVMVLVAASVGPRASSASLPGPPSSTFGEDERASGASPVSRSLPPPPEIRSEPPSP